jgi:hypothetical protein
VFLNVGVGLLVFVVYAVIAWSVSTHGPPRAASFAIELAGLGVFGVISLAMGLLYGAGRMSVEKSPGERGTS